MADELLLEGRQYVSAKRASDLSGYARDYIGQLARKGLIDSQRVGGLWYISMDSLNSYQKHTDTYAPQPPKREYKEVDTIVSFDGKDYISAARASKVTGYNQDYVGQLARSGKVLSRQVGNRWYVEREGLLQHKLQKDALLAAVQRESVGLAPGMAAVDPAVDLKSETELYHRYIPETKKALLPVLRSQGIATQADGRSTQVPIHVVSSMRLPRERHRGATAPTQSLVRTSGKTIHRAAVALSVLTFVIMLSYGITALRGGVLYAFHDREVAGTLRSMAAAAYDSTALVRILDLLESLVGRELTYRRGGD